MTEQAKGGRPSFDGAFQPQPRAEGMRVSDVVSTSPAPGGERFEQEQRRSEALFRLVEENVKEVIWTMDLALRFTYVSPSEFEMTGFTVEEALALSAKDVLTPQSMERAGQLLARELANELYGTQTPSRSVVVEFDQYRKDGSVFPTEATITFLRDEAGKPVGLLGVSRDITERRQTEALLAKQHDLALSLGATSDLDQALALCLDAAIEIAGMEAGGIYLVDPASGGLRLVRSTGLSARFREVTAGFAADSPPAQLVLRGEPVYGDYGRLGLPSDEVRRGEGLRAIAVLPIVHDGKVLACMNLASRSRDDVPPSCRAAVEAVVSRLGSVIARVRAETALRESEAALRRSQRTAQAMLDATPHVVVVVDREGRLIDANHAAAKGLGVTVDGLRQRSVWELCAPHLVDERRRAFDRMLRTGHSVCLVDTSNDGTRSFETTLSPILDEEGVVGAVALAYDMTERIRNEQALRDAGRRLQSIIRVSPVGIGTVRDRVIREVNDRLCKMTGYSPAELVGKSARLLYPSDDEYDFVGAEKYRQIAERGEGAVETRWRRKDGEIIDVLLASTPLAPEDGGGELTFTALDITERRRAEQERLQWHAQRERMQKSESLVTLAGGIAHDFNNILTGLLVNTDVALTETPADSPMREVLVDIQSAGRRAADLTGQMLAYSGRGAYSLTKVDISALVASMESPLRSALSEKVSLTFDLAAHLPTAVADAGQLRQVIVNLVTNASEAVGESQGHVTIRTCSMDCSASYFANASVGSELAEGRYVVIEVADTGPGFDDATKAKVFDPFFTTKFTGRGLGLASVQGIVRGHHGAVLVESHPDEGTTFRVLLPASGPALGSVEQPPVGRDGWRGSGTVLVVDDEEMILRAAGRMLRRLGFSVLAASDGVEAVELFRERHGEICCVLLDVKMPRMGGRETFEQLRQIDASIPVIMTSGYSESESAKGLGAKGLAGFIEKPYEPASLGAKLRDVLGEKR